MKPIIENKDLPIAINYGDMVGFIEENCGLDEDESWTFGENLVNGLMGDESISHFNYESVKNDTYMERMGLNDEKEWLLKFFEAHPFIKKFVLYFDD